MVKRISVRGSSSASQISPDRDVKTVEPLVPVQPTIDTGFVVREQLSTLISARRKPPSLKMAKMVAANESVAGDLSPEGLALLGDVRGDVLAYHITELSLRLSKLDQTELTDAHKRGITAVNQLTRMFEHLHIMRTSQPTQ
ncbi:MAG: hypothetical protein ABJP33_13085 [Pseudoruegeria sp.]